MIIFAVETSCDETACAIVKNGRKVIANVVASQIKIHKNYGGVVPEVASRLHLEAINQVIDETIIQSGLKWSDIDIFASTAGPGLVGSLIVGYNAAKALSLVYEKPFRSVNHLHGHVCANFLETDLQPPFICLLISGGHTQIIKVDDYNKFEIVGETIDDAVGEVYDKVARLLGLNYPGGIELDKLAQTGNPQKFTLPDAKVAEFDFSFSGLKTAVLRLIQSFQNEVPKADVAASFQERVSETLLKKVKNCADKNNYQTIVLGGGVAANSAIRKKFFELQNQGYNIFAPQMCFCTDNAAMIASAGYFCPLGENLDTEVFSRV